MPLSHTDPDDKDLGSLAALFWQHHDRFVGGEGVDIVAEVRAPSGMERGAFDEMLVGADARVAELLADPAERDDMVLAVVFGRRNNDADLDALGEGLLGDLVRGGDDDLLLRLRHHGVEASVVAVIGRAVTGL